MAFCIKKRIKKNEEKKKKKNEPKKPEVQDDRVVVKVKPNPPPNFTKNAEVVITQETDGQKTSKSCPAMILDHALIIKEDECIITQIPVTVNEGEDESTHQTDEIASEIEN